MKIKASVVRKRLESVKLVNGCVILADIRRAFGAPDGSGTVNSIADACHERGILKMFGYRGNRKYATESNVLFTGGRKRLSVIDAGILIGVLFERFYDIRQIVKQIDAQRIEQRKPRGATA